MAVPPRQTGEPVPSATGIGRGRRVTSFPGWLTVLFVLAIGLILWIGVLSNSSGHLTMPGTDSILYVAAVIGAVVLLAWSDLKRGASEELHRHK